MAAGPMPPQRPTKVPTLAAGRRLGQAEAGQAGCDDATAGGEVRCEIPEHVAGAGMAVQQQDPGASVSPALQWNTSKDPTARVLYVVSSNISFGCRSIVGVVVATPVSARRQRRCLWRGPVQQGFPVGKQTEGWVTQRRWRSTAQTNPAPPKVIPENLFRCGSGHPALPSYSKRGNVMAPAKRDAARSAPADNSGRCALGERKHRHCIEGTQRSWPTDGRHACPGKGSRDQTSVPPQ